MADFEQVVIAPKTEGKGRSFRALLVHSASADPLWEMGKADKHDRPVCATFAATESELRAFVANLLCGRPAVPTEGGRTHCRRRGVEAGYEFMRSAGYKVVFQRHEEGSLATVYLPDLLGWDPGMVDPRGVKFVLCPGTVYFRREAEKMPVGEMVAYARGLPCVQKVNEPETDWRGHVRDGWEEPLSREALAGMAPLAYLHALYLSSRSRAPIPPDGRFYLQLLLACLAKGLASLATEEYGRRGFGRNPAYKFTEDGIGEVFAPGLAFMADHAEVEAVLAAECASYFERTEGK